MAEDDVDAEKHELELLLGQSPDAIGECPTVESDDLRDVGDRVLRQAGEPGVEQDVAGCFGPAQVAGQGDTDDGRDVAAVEDVPLDDHDRAPKAGLGAGRLLEVGPPDLALGDHQSERPSVRRAAACVNSLLGATSAQTRSSVSVTLSAE